MTPARAFGNSSFQLAALYTIIFAVSVLILGAGVFLTTRAALAEQVDSRISSETQALMNEYRVGGLQALSREVGERGRDPGHFEYGLLDRSGARLAGALDMHGARVGWSNARLNEVGEGQERERLLVTSLGDNGWLLVSDHLDRIEEVTEVILKAFAGMSLLVLFLGGAGGFLLSRGVMYRIDSIARTAQSIIDGDLSRRIPIGSQPMDDLGRLATTLNGMLDRIQTLIESLKQVSSDVAHDLRTPLTRLRQRLETALISDDQTSRTFAIERAIADSDGLINTFNALLRIAQVEAGARRSAFRPVDLNEVGQTVVDAYAPSAEDAGAALVLERGARADISGDQDLLVQMIANLVENAMLHAGNHPRIKVRIWGDEDIQLVVEDDGCGVSAEMREKVFERFYRLEHSRTTAGNGLGLSMVRAIAKLHGASIWLEDAKPGLRVRLSFAPTRATPAA